jgi:polysaccharide export outer membrane protein
VILGKILLCALAFAALIPLPAFAGQIAVTTPREDLSALETAYSIRAGQKLQQFGYDLFAVPGPDIRKQLDKAAAFSPRMPTGDARDEFLLHPGDELEIAFTGQRTDHGLYKITSEGLLSVPGLPPIPAEGRAIGQVRLSVKAAARTLHNVDAHVSLSSVRQIEVLVTGHVQRPGRQNLTIFHTVVDALIEAGGINKDGSLRQIRLVRRGGSAPIDLYALLLHGSGADLQLQDGDRIIVPPIGPVMAVAGKAKRPGIYELLPGENRQALAAALGFDRDAVLLSAKNGDSLGQVHDNLADAAPFTDDRDAAKGR